MHGRPSQTLNEDGQVYLYLNYITILAAKMENFLIKQLDAGCFQCGGEVKFHVRGCVPIKW